MYVDETGADDTATDSTADAGHDELTVEVGGEEYEVQENFDYDQDGDNDTAVVQTEDGYIAFADTDGDGNADTAVQLDDQGNVVAAAEYNETSGEWTESDANSVNAPGGDGADEHGSKSPSHDSGDDAATPVNSGSGDDITVDTKSGDVTAGEAQYDADGDGTNDTAVVTDEQGNTYAFTDNDGDGEADEAIVIEADGDVTVAQHTGEDEWSTVETGHINADGSYESDSAGAAPTAAGSDANWQG